MAIKLTPQFSENDIRNFITGRVKIIEDTVFDLMQQVGEQFVYDARSTRTYKDRTRNLRSSIGYVIVKDGNEVFGNFEGTQEGRSVSKRVIKTIQAEYPKGYALIAVAGMNYAAFVEAKGYDVITGSSQVAEVNIKRAFNRLKQSMNKL